MIVINNIFIKEHFYEKESFVIYIFYGFIFYNFSVFYGGNRRFRGKKISFKVHYRNLTLSDRKKLDDVRFTLRCNDGKKEQEIGEFSFNVGAEVPVCPGVITYSHGEGEMTTASLS